MLRQAFYLLSSLALATATISDCSKGSSVFQVTDLALKPDPPVKGQPLDMIVKFNNPGFTVVDGTATTSLTLNFIPYPASSTPLCESTMCPIEMGANDRSTSSIWPDSVSGSVQSKIVWTSTEGVQLLCIQISTKVAVANMIRKRASLEELESIQNILHLWGPDHELESAWGVSHEALFRDSLENSTQILNARENATATTF
jgi:hypothetical protein